MDIIRKLKKCFDFNHTDDDSEIAKLSLNLLKDNLKLMKLLGLAKRVTNYLRVFVVSCSVFIMFLGSALFVLQNKYNLSDKVEPFLAAFFVLASYLKLCMIIYKKNKLFEFIDCVESVWMEKENEEFKYILNKTERRSSMFVIWYSSVTSLMMATVTVGPVFYYIGQKYILNMPDAQLKAMYRVDFIFEMNGYFIYFLSAITGWIDVCLVFCMDSLFPPFALHTAAIFQLLDKKLINIVNDGNNLDNRNELGLREKLFKTKTSFVKLQATAIECSNLLEDIFNVPLLIQISFSSVKICVVLWRISMIGGNNYTTTSSDPPSMWVIFIGVLISELYVNYLHCYFGQYIDYEAAKVTETLYDMNWYEIKDNNLKRMIQMLLQRSQSPVVVTAGKFYVIKLQTYIQILKGAYAYFAYMRSAAGYNK